MTSTSFRIYDVLRGGSGSVAGSPTTPASTTPFPRGSQVTQNFMIEPPSPPDLRARPATACKLLRVRIEQTTARMSAEIEQKFEERAEQKSTAPMPNASSSRFRRPRTCFASAPCRSDSFFPPATITTLPSDGPRAVQALCHGLEHDLRACPYRVRTAGFLEHRHHPFRYLGHLQVSIVNGSPELAAALPPVQLHGD